VLLSFGWGSGWDQLLCVRYDKTTSMLSLTSFKVWFFMSYLLWESWGRSGNVGTHFLNSPTITLCNLWTRHCSLITHAGIALLPTAKGSLVEPMHGYNMHVSKKSLIWTCWDQGVRAWHSLGLMNQKIVSNYRNLGGWSHLCVFIWEYVRDWGHDCG